MISKHSEQWMNCYTGVSVSDRFLFSFSLLAVPTACGNLVPQLETKPILPTLGSCTHNPQTIREVPLVIFNDIFFSFANKLYKELKKKVYIQNSGLIWCSEVGKRKATIWKYVNQTVKAKSGRKIRKSFCSVFLKSTTVQAKLWARLREVGLN